MEIIGVKKHLHVFWKPFEKHRDHSEITQGKYFRLTVAAILLNIIFNTVCFAASVNIENFDSEIDVRIGILQKTADARLNFDGEFTIHKAGSGEELYKGKDEEIHVELYRVRLQQLQDQFRVSLGKFRSFEQAEFTAQSIRGVSSRPKIVQPDNWSLWFGPFNTEYEAKAVETELRTAGYANTHIETISQDINVLTAYTQNEKLIHLGNTSLLFTPKKESFKLNGREYRGTAEAALDSYGTFTVINVLKAEDYLYSVLPREMPPLAGQEALKSQAVIARTYLMNNLHRHTEDLFNLCARPDCQVYGGVPNEHENTTRAAKETRGQVLAHGKYLVNALFHSTCGGRTAAYSDAWSGDAPEYLVSVDDGSGTGNKSLASHKLAGEFLDNDEGYCSVSKYFRWDKTYSTNEMQSLLESTVPEFSNKPDLKLGKVTDVRVKKYSDSGRVLELEIVTKDATYVFEKDTVRWVLGNLKSTLLTIDKKSNGYKIRGAGWGHGVGLCQIGAMQMAKKDYNYKQILNHYYPDTRIEKLW